MSKICDDLRAAILQAFIYDPEKCPKNKKEYLVTLSDLSVEYLRGNGLRKTDIVKSGKYECVLYGELFTKYHDGVIDIESLSKTNIENTVKSQCGDILIPGTSTASKEVMLRAREIYKDGVEIGGDINIIRPKAKNMFYPRYVACVFDVLSSKRQLFQHITGTTGIIHISNSGIKNLVFYLPPISEQKRIVEKVDELLARVADLEQSADALASLKKAFPDDIKASLLQAAMQGKLTKQLPEDGSAENLLEEIKAEKEKLISEGKIKKQKHLAPITDDEIPFNIPDSWKWTKLGEMVTVLGGKRIPAGKKLTKNDTGHVYIRVSDMKGNTVSTNDLQYVPEDIYLGISRYIINKDDIYITVAGTIGRVGKIPPELDGANLTENADRIVFNRINQDWLIWCLSSPIAQNQIHDATTQVGQPKLAIKRIEELLIPLPPLTEQKRIVERLENLMQNINTVGDLIASE